MEKTLKSLMKEAILDKLSSLSQNEGVYRKKLKKDVLSSGFLCPELLARIIPKNYVSLSEADLVDKCKRKLDRLFSEALDSLDDDGILYVDYDRRKHKSKIIMR